MRTPVGIIRKAALWDYAAIGITGTTLPLPSLTSFPITATTSPSAVAPEPYQSRLCDHRIIDAQDVEIRQRREVLQPFLADHGAVKA